MSIRRRGQSLEPDDVDAGLDVEPDSPDELDVVEVDVFSGVFDDPSPPESLSLSPESLSLSPEDASPSPDDVLFTAARRSFLAQPDPLKWMAGAAIALRTGPEPHSGHCSGGPSWTPWMTSNRRPQAAQS
jgi:hypothetical protein